jgi:dTDP-4-dehydrorhamnose 3,5-epimerase
VKITDVKALRISEAKVIRFARFCDQRGYFTEHFRKSDFRSSSLTTFINAVDFVQANESFSKAGTVRGLHFQWNPHMGKLVRTLSGHMIDLILDIRKGSPNFGQVIAYDMPSSGSQDFGEWVWAPPGFAHGNVFLEDTFIEYFCSAEYSPECEAGIAPLAPDLDWSLCEPRLRELFHKIASNTVLITNKDRNGPSLSQWESDIRSDNFVYIA